MRGLKITVNWQKMHFTGQNQKKWKKRTLIIFQFCINICPPTFSGSPLGWVSDIISKNSQGKKLRHISKFSTGHTKFLAWSECLIQKKSPRSAWGTVWNMYLRRKKKKDLLCQTKQWKEEDIHIHPSYFQCTDVLCTHHSVPHFDILLQTDPFLGKILLPLLLWCYSGYIPPLQSTVQDLKWKH